MTSSPAAPADYWSVLGLEPGADASNLKRAFRAQARRWHPDLNGNDPLAEERFKLVNEAYAVLSDPRRRQVWEAGMPADGPGRESQDPFASGFPDFEAYLDVLFGERRRSRRAAEPEWQEPEPEPSAENPPQASGSVTAAPPPPPPVRASSDQESLVELTPEQALQGERLELELADGTAVEVWTPPFAGDGWRLRLAGVTPGGGDHFLQLRVRTEEGLRIDGLRVLYPLELTPAEAALGCQVVVPTLRGPVKLRVPAGSSSGRLLRLRGRGQEWAEQRGDQLVEVRILVPEQLGEAEAALYKRLQELADDPDDQHR
ncbi:MAG: molecular chaperone DnaJ [cyanobacterium BACL30 MAG-120619-bin27]|nr:MAG: molecular chaperone DnaJ [cyanobacterium BACL30 MAG-120619-bin27]MDP4681943.1 DnaJ domain-containing protein [Cyanobium sp. MAG_255]MDP4830926.1 DnaJ domain-containing protein [Cyanobium sp. MAG_185]